ncbi:MAG: hypothetical protein ABIQ86_13930 [Steroidobacteraceae bacterium]
MRAPWRTQRRVGGQEIFAGLLPIMWSHGTGSELMQRIAAPLLSMLILPVVYQRLRPPRGIGAQ